MLGYNTQRDLHKLHFFAIFTDPFGDLREVADHGKPDASQTRPHLLAGPFFLFQPHGLVLPLGLASREQTKERASVWGRKRFNAQMKSDPSRLCTM